MIKFQQSQASTSPFESFWSIVESGLMLTKLSANFFSLIAKRTPFQVSSNYSTLPNNGSTTIIYFEKNCRPLRAL